MQEEEKVTASDDAQKEIPGMIGVSEKFALLNRLITRDLNNNTSQPTFSLYTKADIQRYLTNPYAYEKQLRRAVTYIYGASSHFRRLIQYFVGLNDCCYVVEPYRVDPKKASVKMMNSNYRKVINMLSSINLKTQLPKILTVCLREDIFYGTLWTSQDNITIQQLPSDYCAISAIEGNVLNVTFDFSYFDSHPNFLAFYPQEFKLKYEQYKNSRSKRWIELDSPTSFAIKCSTDILDYPIPPFAGILREIYDIEDYKQKKNTKATLENYAMLVMTLPMDSDGRWLLDYSKASDFWRNLDAVLPEEIGSILTPMPIEKISFEKSNTKDTDTVAEAEQHLFTASGVQSSLFNNDQASANALVLSIKADQAITYGIVKSVEDALNRFIQSQTYGKNFRVNFLDVSRFNKKEVGDAYLKAATYGFPTLSYYCASQGVGQAEMDSMSFLETEVLGLQKMFTPVRSSTQMSAEEAASEEGGAPQKDIGEVSDKREANEESE